MAGVDTRCQAICESQRAVRRVSFLIRQEEAMDVPGQRRASGAFCHDADERVLTWPVWFWTRCQQSGHRRPAAISRRRVRLVASDKNSRLYCWERSRTRCGPGYRGRILSSCFRRERRDTRLPGRFWDRGGPSHPCRRRNTRRSRPDRFPRRKEWDRGRSLWPPGKAFVLGSKRSMRPPRYSATQDHAIGGNFLMRRGQPPGVGGA